MSPPTDILPSAELFWGLELGRRARIAASSAWPVLLGAALLISHVPCIRGRTLDSHSYSASLLGIGPGPGDRGV